MSFDSKDFEPLRVRAWLRGGVISDAFLPLDGILYYQINRYTYGEQSITIPGKASTPEGEYLMLPLDVGGSRDDWYYHCSWAQWAPGTTEATDHWNKRFDNNFSDYVDFGKRRGKVVVEKGQYKTFHMPIFYRTALWVEWYCVGDAESIKNLLSTVTHIGKKTSQGWGRVYRWEVDPVSQDFSVIGKNGALARGVPREDAMALQKEIFSLKLGNYGIRPSYWLPDHQRILVLP